MGTGVAVCLPYRAGMSIPSIIITGPTGPVAPGASITLQVQATDDDNRTEHIAGHRADGLAVDLTEVYTDDLTIIGAVWLSTGRQLAVDGWTLVGTAADSATEDVVRVTVRDSQGNQPYADFPVSVVAPPPGTRIGVDSDTTTTVAAWEAAYAPYAGVATGCTKLFWSATKGLPTWSKYPVPYTAIPHVCFADWPTETQFRAFLDAYPSTWGRALITYLHEGDRKTTLADYRARYATLAGWMDEAPAGVELMPNITGSWQENHGAQWADWIGGYDERIRTVGVDIYVGGQSGYRPIDVMLDPAADAADAAGVTLVVPEWAVIVPPSPTAANLAERAAWITASGAVLRSRRVFAAGWWDGPPTSQVGTFRLAAGDPGRAALLAELAR